MMPQRFFLTTVLAVFFMTSAALAQETYVQFDDKITYDVYFSNAERLTVINSVEIRGFQEIGGKLFLKVQPAGFNLKDYEGFILFDSIQAILPDRNYQVKDQ